MLQKTGESSDTVIVFTSDNGYLHGEHRLRQDEARRWAFRVLMISVPPRLGGGPRGRRQVDEPVANIDIAPTILELARATPCRPRATAGRWTADLWCRCCAVRWPGGRRSGRRARAPATGYSSCSYRGLRVGDEIYVEHSSIPFGTGLPARARGRALRPRRRRVSTPAHRPRSPGSPATAREEDLADRLATLRTCAGIAGRDRRADRPHLRMRAHVLDTGNEASGRARRPGVAVLALCVVSGGALAAGGRRPLAVGAGAIDRPTTRRSRCCTGIHAECFQADSRAGDDVHELDRHHSAAAPRGRAC